MLTTNFCYIICIFKGVDRMFKNSKNIGELRQRYFLEVKLKKYFVPLMKQNSLYSKFSTLH